MSDSTNPQRVDVERLRELLEKAAPGPWVANESEVLPPNSCGTVECCGIAECYHGSRQETAYANADLIAAAVNALPALLQQLADYQRQRAELYDRLNGTPCAEIRWLQEREQLMGELLSLRNACGAGADLDNDDLRDDAGFWFNVAAFRGIELTRQVERAEAAERGETITQLRAKLAERDAEIARLSQNVTVRYMTVPVVKLPNQEIVTAEQVMALRNRNLEGWRLATQRGIELKAAERAREEACGFLREFVDVDARPNSMSARIAAFLAANGGT